MKSPRTTLRLSQQRRTSRKHSKIQLSYRSSSSNFQVFVDQARREAFIPPGFRIYSRPSRTIFPAPLEVEAETRHQPDSSFQLSCG